MRIALVDSGIARAFLQHHPLPLGGGAAFVLDPETGTLEVTSYEAGELAAWVAGALPDCRIEDASGHGTAVASLLYRELGNHAALEVWPVRVLDAEGRGHGLCLAEALEWLGEQPPFELVNLSLGTEERRFEARLQAAVDRLRTRGTRLFAAHGLPHGLPACLAGVEAVPAGGGFLEAHLDGAWQCVPETSSFASALAAARAVAGWLEGRRVWRRRPDSNR
jgi:hypothetical protein